MGEITGTSGHVGAERGLSEADAIMAIAIAATITDGKVRECEIVRLRMLAYLNPMFEELGDVDEYIGNMLKVIADEGWGDMLDRAVALLSPRMKEMAYAWAAEITFCDRVMHEGEHVYLRHLRGRLGIHGALAGKINAVTEIRNRCS